MMTEQVRSSNKALLYVSSSAVVPALWVGEVGESADGALAPTVR